MAVLGGAINNKGRWNFDDVDDVPGAPGTPIHESWFFKRMDSYSIDEIKVVSKLWIKMADFHRK